MRFFIAKFSDDIKVKIRKEGVRPTVPNAGCDFQRIASDVKFQRICCDCYMAHIPSSAVGKGWKDFKFSVLKSQVLDAVQCQVVSVDEIVIEEGLEEGCGVCILRLGH